MAETPHESSAQTVEPIEQATAVEHAPIAFINRLFVGHSLGRL
jgi:hypothetical protein